MENVVYKNLNNGTWSVAALSGRVGRGLVERHAPSVTLRHVRFNVQQGAREKVASGGNRSVHAWAIGTVLSPSDTPQFGRGLEISYNPRRADCVSFHTRAGRPVEYCEYVHFGADGIVTAYGKIR